MLLLFATVCILGTFHLQEEHFSNVVPFLTLKALSTFVVMVVVAVVVAVGVV